MNLMMKICCVVIALFLSGCRSGNAPQDSGTGAKEKRQLIVASKAFTEGGVIPKQYSCDGANISPPLQWDAAPDGTKTFALIADDPDAPNGMWVHWVLYNLPASTRELKENIPPQEKLTSGARQGTNDFRQTGYGGPCPPAGAHRYYFKLYALDTELSPDAVTTKEQLLKAMEGHILAQGQLMGKYQR